MMPRLVRRFERVGDLAGVVDGGVEGERAFQRFAFDEFHHQRALLDAVHGGDIRVIQCGEGSGFALESRQPFGVARDGLRENLDGYVASEARVVSAIYDAHATLAEFGADAIVPELLACHCFLSSAGQFCTTWIAVGLAASGSSG